MCTKGKFMPQPRKPFSHHLIELYFVKGEIGGRPANFLETNFQKGRLTERDLTVLFKESGWSPRTVARFIGKINARQLTLGEMLKRAHAAARGERLPLDVKNRLITCKRGEFHKVYRDIVIDYPLRQADVFSLILERIHHLRLPREVEEDYMELWEALKKADKQYGNKIRQLKQPGLTRVEEQQLKRVVERLRQDFERARADIKDFMRMRL